MGPRFRRNSRLPVGQHSYLCFVFSATMRPVATTRLLGNHVGVQKRTERKNDKGPDKIKCVRASKGLMKISSFYFAKIYFTILPQILPELVKSGQKC